MSRRKKDYQDQNDVNEPWDQPIYDEGEEYTRSGKRNKKKSNTKFLTTVLILIFLIAAIPITAGAWVVFQKNKPVTPKATVETSISSTVESSSTQSSETSTTTSERTETTSSETATKESTQPANHEADQNQNNQTNQNQTTNNGTAEYIEVLAGEGPNSIASRAGISVEELYRLNGMNENNFHFNPGQSVRIR